MGLQAFLNSKTVMPVDAVLAGLLLSEVDDLVEALDLDGLIARLFPADEPCSPPPPAFIWGLSDSFIQLEAQFNAECELCCLCSRPRDLPGRVRCSVCAEADSVKVKEAVRRRKAGRKAGGR